MKNPAELKNTREYRELELQDNDDDYNETEDTESEDSDDQDDNNDSQDRQSDDSDSEDENEEHEDKNEIDDDDENDDKKSEQISLTRQHPLVILTLIATTLTGRHLRKISLRCLKISPHFINALRLFKNLNSLSLLECNADEFTNEGVKLIKLKKIHNLEFDLHADNDAALKKYFSAFSRNCMLQ